MPFFGQSLGDFKNRIGGLLDTESGQLQGLTANPVFGLGMGLLGANADPKQSLAAGALAGLTQAKKQAQSDEDRQRQQKTREDLQALIEAQRQATMGDPVTAAEQAAQMSFIPGMAGSGVAPAGTAPPGGFIPGMTPPIAGQQTGDPSRVRQYAPNPLQIRMMWEQAGLGKTE